MNDERHGSQEERLLQQGLTFFGRITASVSHELNNVISIIDQTVGLLEDSLAVAESGPPIATEKLESIVGSVQKQTARGLGIIKRLNKFAHSTDHPDGEFDVNEAVRNLTELSERLAGLKRVKLEVQLSPVPLNVKGNQFFLQQALFESIRFCLSVSEKDDIIKITAQEDEAGAEVSVDGPSGEQGEFDISFFQSLLDHTPGRVEVKQDAGRTKFQFLFQGRK